MAQASTFAIPNKTVANAAALIALTGLAALLDGAVAHVETYDDDFELVTQDGGGSPAITADVVLGSSAGGRVWARRTVTSQKWLKQSIWHIDPANAGASNQNTGLAGSPLAAIEEYTRRVGSAPRVDAQVDIFIDSDTPAGDNLVISPNVQPNGFWFLHGGFVQTGAGQLTASRGRVIATNTPVGVTDAAQNWTLRTDEIFVDTTAGANLNAMAWIVKDEGGGVGRLTSVVQVDATAQFLQTAATEITPGAVDTYTINRLVKISGDISITPTGPFSFTASKGRVVIDKVHFTPSTAGRTPFIVILANGPQMALTTCRFGSTTLFGAGGLLLNVVNCYSTVAWNPNSNSRGNVVAGGIRAATYFCEGNWTLKGGFLLQGASTFNGLYATPIAFTDAAIFDWTGAAVTLDFGSVAQIANLWGTSAVAGSFVFNVRRGFVEYEVSAAVALPIAGAVATFTINGRTTGPAVDFAAGPPVAFTANRAYTFANLDATVAAGGFGGGVVEPSSACSIHLHV